MELRTGTSGYSYDEWKGCFYPDELPARERLAFYGEQLPAVEISNTFYRLPGASVLEHWCEQVPEGFRFVIKASRRITHSKRLKETEDETGYLLRTVATLGPRLGALLFQLPPRLHCDLPRLEKFMALLPEGTRAAFEFQHDSWRDDAVHAALRERGFALVQADAASGGDAEDLAAPTGPVDLVSTAPWGYLRLRRPDYSPADLSAWAERLRATGWDEAFVFFNHEEAGAAPRMAAEFLDVAARVFERKRPAARGPEPRRKAG